MSPEYINNRVSDEEVERRRRELQKASNERKIGRWFAYRHYLQLRREQHQEFHHHYLTLHDGDRAKIVCTCGMYVFEGDVPSQNLPKWDFQLDSVQAASGHRRLPECEGKVIALIVGFTWVEEAGIYIWRAYCQECFEFIADVSGNDADAFVESHNKSCLK